MTEREYDEIMPFVMGDALFIGAAYLIFHFLNDMLGLGWTVIIIFFLFIFKAKLYKNMLESAFEAGRKKGRSEK